MRESRGRVYVSCAARSVSKVFERSGLVFGQFGGQPELAAALPGSDELLRVCENGETKAGGAVTKHAAMAVFFEEFARILPIGPWPLSAVP